jgi:hypothetical protein
MRLDDARLLADFSSLRKLSALIGWRSTTVASASGHVAAPPLMGGRDDCNDEI